MRNWQLEVGIYPGILVGARTYQNDNNNEWVIYLPFFELILTFFKDEED